MVQQFSKTNVPPTLIRTTRDRRPLEWVLSTTYAALLTAAIWKLDNAHLPVDVTPMPTVASTVARTQQLMLGFTETLRAGPVPAPIGGQQSQPEGWPLWNGSPDERAPSRSAVEAQPSAAPNPH